MFTKHNNYRILVHITRPRIKRAPSYSARFFCFQFKTIRITRTTVLRAYGMITSRVVIYTLNHTSSCFIAFELFCQVESSNGLVLISSEDLIAFVFVDNNFISIWFHSRVYFLK